ncbi:MAG: uracil-DNA glycosylase [Rhodospirillales bacterium]|nr:uracil-DNA glycosylase [Rhodospirillales bacterium]
MSVEADAIEPGRECPRCPRLVAFRDANRALHPQWHNAPVASFKPAPGSSEVWLLIVGLAPGLRGANRTGRPFTGDFAGNLLYRTLIRFGLAAGDYDARSDDGLSLVGCRITNAVRCVPPANKPTPAEIAACRPYLYAEINALPRLQAIAALGAVAHDAVLAALGLSRKEHPFAHGVRYRLPCGIDLAASYHCSRQNTNTGRLTPAMFEDVFKDLVAFRRS